MTKILFLGDVFSKVGRLLIKKRLSSLIYHEELDLCLANAENASGGLGLTVECAIELLDDGLNALTGGNHTFKHKEIEDLLDSDPRLIRPANYPAPCPGKGWTIIDTPSGVRVGIGNVMGRVFISQTLECPFRTSERLISEMKKAGADITIIDIHAEATSEKMALAWHLDGKLGALLGTHTHIQTADAQILPGGTAYMTDVGMTGPHQSVIGMCKEEAILALTTGRNHRFKPANRGPIMQGAIIEFGNKGQATDIKPLKIEGLPE
jgi:metallophosphoesterase (TIGR00282 family)